MDIQNSKQIRRITIIGIVFSIIGIAGIAAPVFFTIAFEQLVAWLLSFAGVSGLVLAWHLRGDKGSASNGLVAVLTLLLGLVFLFYPMAGSATLAWLLVALFVLEGVASILFGWTLRAERSGWFWMIISGIVSLVVAFMILEGWPGTATWVVGLLIGINFLSTGISLIFLSSHMRKES